MMEAIWKRRNSDEGGFTLVEMLVVIAILGILAAVAVFALGGTASTSKGAACKTDVQTVQAAADAFYAKTNGYPTSVAALVPTYLRSPPPTTNYTISVAQDGTGTVSALPACTTF
jgi:prepilin-type N-terminal cleavage/methylation domain-containing protein